MVLRPAARRDSGQGAREVRELLLVFAELLLLAVVVAESLFAFRGRLVPPEVPGS